MRQKFPYLEIPGDSEEERELYFAKLVAESKKIKKKFSDLILDIKDELKKQGKTVKDLMLLTL